MESTTDSLRLLRDYLLKSTDWTQVGDVTLENGDEWVAYRQALRDLPSLETPVWPEPPQVKIVEGVDENTRVKRLEEELKTHTHSLEPHTHPFQEHTHSDLQTKQTELKDLLSETKTELKADLQTTKEDLQTTQTELTEERALHETTRTQLRNTQTELDVAKIKLLNIEARMQIIESNISKVVV